MAEKLSAAVKHLKQSSLKSMFISVQSSSTISKAPPAAEAEPLPSTSSAVPSEAVAQDTCRKNDLLEQCQPTEYNFPQRRFGNKTFSRSCKPAWFKRWPWLHYVKDKDQVFCFICMQADVQGLFHNITKRDTCFTTSGFSNWRKATERFNAHEYCAAHKDAAERLSPLSRKPVIAMLSDAAAREQQVARRVLYDIFKTVRFLGREGLPFRGDEHNDGVFWQLLNDRCSDDKEMSWLQNRNNWSSDTVQNEIIQMFGHGVQRQLLALIMDSPYFGLVADGTTDQTGKEQFSICLQHVSTDLESSCDFLGFYNAPDSTADTLFKVIKDVFLRLGIPMDRLQGYCFDGASNMSGRISGLQKRLTDVCEGALYVHCSNHSLDLVLQEVCRDVRLVADSLNFVREVTNVIRESSKRGSLFESMFEQGEAKRLLGLCPTR